MKRIILEAILMSFIAFGSCIILDAIFLNEPMWKENMMVGGTIGVISFGFDFIFNKHKKW